MFHALTSRRPYQIVILAIIGAVLVRVFVLDSFIVQGDSMAPSIIAGDYVFVEKFAYQRREPAPGDIVVGRFRELDIRAIKRVIAVPPEWVTVTPTEIFVQDGREGTSTRVADRQYIELPGEATNGATSTYRLDPYEYFVLGDNRAISEDSRTFGPMDRFSVKGVVIARFRFSNFSYKIF